MDLSLLHLAQHRPGARDAASPSSMPVKPDLDSSSSIASTSSIGGPTHSYSRHPAFPRGDDANFAYRKLNGERSPSNGDEPLRKKQKRNKPTLSCHECVERKTKVSMFLIVRITAIFSLGAVSSSSGFLLSEDRPLCVVFGTVHIMPFLHEFFLVSSCIALQWSLGISRTCSTCTVARHLAVTLHPGWSHVPPQRIPTSCCFQQIPNSGSESSLYNLGPGDFFHITVPQLALISESKKKKAFNN